MLQLRMSSDGHIIGTEFLTDLVEKGQAHDHSHSHSHGHAHDHGNTICAVYLLFLR